MKHLEESPDMFEVITQAYEEAENQPSSQDVVLEEKKSPDSTIVEDKQPEEEVEEKEEKETAKPEEEEKSEDEEKEPEEEIKFPTHVPPYVQDVLKTIKDKEIRESMLNLHSRMNSHMQDKSRELSEQKRLAENIHGAFERHGKASVKDKVAHLESYLKFEKVADENPKIAIRKMMEALRVNPEELLNELVYDGDKVRESSLEFENSNLKQQISSYEQNRMKEEVERQTEDFKNEKDDTGNLKHPHFEKLKVEMAKLMKIEPDLSLEKLYNKACRLDDDLYNESLEKEKSKVAKKTEEKLKVKKAKDISSQNITSKPYDTTPKGWNEKLKADLDALQW